LHSFDLVYVSGTAVASVESWELERFESCMLTLMELVVRHIHRADDACQLRAEGSKVAA